MSAVGMYGGFETTSAAGPTTPSSSDVRTNPTRSATPCRCALRAATARAAARDVGGDDAGGRELAGQADGEAAAAGADVDQERLVGTIGGGKPYTRSRVLRVQAVPFPPSPGYGGPAVALRAEAGRGGVIGGANAPPHKRQRLLDDDLGLGPRGEHVGSDLELQAPELPAADDRRDRLAARCAWRRAVRTQAGSPRAAGRSRGRRSCARSHPSA